MGAYLLFPQPLSQALIFNPQEAWPPVWVFEIKSVVLLGTHLGELEQSLCGRIQGGPEEWLLKNWAQGTCKALGYFSTCVMNNTIHTVMIFA